MAQLGFWLTTSCRGVGVFRTHVSRVAPDWDLWKDALLAELQRRSFLLSEQLLELFSDRLEGELLVPAAVRPSQVGREHHRLGALLQGVLDGRQRGHDPGRVGDGASLLVLRDVEVSPRGKD